MNRIIAITLIAVGVVPPVRAVAQSDPSKLLLNQLRTERQAAVTDDLRVRAGKPQIDLKPLLGARREQLLQSLGIPDFCALPMDAACTKSTRIAYFFYPPRPLTAKDMGNGFVEVVTTAGGGWALEANLAHDTVTKVSWVKQE